MEQLNEKPGTGVQKKQVVDFPLEVPDYRFDQKNEMFKRRTWDEEIRPHGDRLYNTINFQERYGYRKLDYALRNAAWNMEYDFGFGNMKSDMGLYSLRYAGAGDPGLYSRLLPGTGSPRQ